MDTYTFVHTINTVAYSSTFSAKKMVISSPMGEVIVACFVAAAVGCHMQPCPQPHPPNHTSLKERCRVILQERSSHLVGERDALGWACSLSLSPSLTFSVMLPTKCSSWENCACCVEVSGSNCGSDAAIFEQDIWAEDLHFILRSPPQESLAAEKDLSVILRVKKQW